MGLITTIGVLLLFGAGFWGWVLGLIFGPMIVFVAAGMAGVIKS